MIDLSKPKISIGGEWSRVRYFVGVNLDYTCKVFSCKFTPTYSTHGKVYLYCFGPYRTKAKAQQVASYQTKGENENG